MYPTPKQTRIPTPLALLAVVAVAIGLSFAIKKPIPTTKTQASQMKVDEMHITNLTYHSVSIYWKTADKKIGWIAYGESPDTLNQLAFDERDLDTKKNSYRIHTVSLANLTPSKNYYFKIVSDDGVVTDTGGKPFHFSTVAQVNTTTNLKPAFGKVVNANSTPLNSGIVLINVENAQPLSSLTKDTTGEFLVPMYFLLKKDTNTLYIPKDTTPATVTIMSEEGEVSHIKTTVSKLSPLDQTIILGKDYDFTVSTTNVLGETSKTTAKLNQIDIIYPTEKALIPASKPRYKGVAIPGKTVLITIKEAKQVYQTTAGKDGVWNIDFPKSLVAGTYTLVLKTANEKGADVTVERTFSILKTGEAVLGEATGSGTITPSPTLPVATATPTTGVLTPTTAVPSVTPQPTYVQTTVTTIPTAIPSLPATGNSYLSYTMASVSLIFLGIGLILLF
jgi:hypothetical protein